MTWIQGLAKGDKCDAVVRDATELGATRVIVAATTRSVVKLDAARAAERQARWARIAQEAARQCGRSDAPLVDAPVPVARGPRACARERRRLLPLGARDRSARAAALRGALARRRRSRSHAARRVASRTARWTTRASSGWLVVSLGPLALRTETVAAAVLGAVRVWSEL